MYFVNYICVCVCVCVGTLPNVYVNCILQIRKSIYNVNSDFPATKIFIILNDHLYVIFLQIITLIQVK